ncbi:hypothetical protein ABZP36_013658 [Zizania latifolia]
MLISSSWDGRIARWSRSSVFSLAAKARIIIMQAFAHGPNLKFARANGHLSLSAPDTLCDRNPMPRRTAAYFLVALLPLAPPAPPPCPAACAAFLAAFSCSALASLSRRCSGVSPSSRPFTTGFRACARCLSRSL